MDKSGATNLSNLKGNVVSFAHTVSRIFVFCLFCFVLYFLQKVQLTSVGDCLFQQCLRVAISKLGNENQTVTHSNENKIDNIEVKS